MKKLLVIPALLSFLIFFTVACDENEEPGENPYENWQERNEAYIDSLDRVSQQAGSDLERIESLLFPKQYIYVKKMQPVLEKTKDGSPFYTDSAFVYYRGKFINDYVFGENYTSEEFDLDFAKSDKFSVKGTVDGFSTALQKMEIGDYWVVYIPYELGYGVAGRSEQGVQVIPGYTTLVYDMILEDFWAPRPK